MKKISQWDIKTALRNTLVEIIGSLAASVGLYNFAVASNFPVSGFSGIAIILFRLFGLPIGAATVLLNIPVIIFCTKLLGRHFVLRSLRCMVIYSVCIDYVAPLLPTYQGDPLLSAICTGVFSGIGFGIIYMDGTSTGGIDFIIMSIKKKLPQLSLGNIIFALDIVIVLLGGAVYSTVDGVIYGIILSFITTSVMDKVMYGMTSGKTAMIITDKAGEITAAIDRKIGRGATILDVRGSYENTPRQIVLCACSSRQMFSIEQAVKHVDPNSFIIILESKEVIGQGFRPLIDG